MYFRGKLSRDRCVTEWRNAVKNYVDGVPLFAPEEFLECIDYDCAEFYAIFSRYPDIRVVKAWAVLGANYERKVLDT